MNSKLRKNIAASTLKLANDVTDVTLRIRSMEVEYPQRCEELEKLLALQGGKRAPAKNIAKAEKIKVINKMKGGKKAPAKKDAPKKRKNLTDHQVEAAVLKELTKSGEELSISALKARLKISHYRIEKILKAAKKMRFVQFSTSMVHGRKVKRWSVVPVLKNGKKLKASKVSAQA